MSYLQLTYHRAAITDAGTCMLLLWKLSVRWSQRTPVQTYRVNYASSWVFEWKGPVPALPLTCQSVNGQHTKPHIAPCGKFESLFGPQAKFKRPLNQCPLALCCQDFFSSKRPCSLTVSTVWHSFHRLANAACQGANTFMKTSRSVFIKRLVQQQWVVSTEKHLHRGMKALQKGGGVLLLREAL